jgi:hypothetical protein
MPGEPYNVDRSVYDVVRDTGRVFSRQAISDDGTDLTGFNSTTNILSADIWAGDNQPSLNIDGLQAYWTNAAQGQYTISVPPIDPTIVDAIYSLRVLMTTGDVSKEIYRGRIRFIDAPGQFCKQLNVYCSYRDVVDHAPWIESLQTDLDRSGFQRQRSAAKNWIDLAIVKRAKVLDNAWMQGSNYLYYGVVPPGFAYSRYIQSLISEGKIMVDQNLSDIAAYYTIHLICETQFSPQGAYGPYLDISRRMYGMAAQRLETAIIQFDTNNDGLPEIAVEIGRASGRSSL